MRHVDDGELHAYLDGARAGLTEAELDRIRHHLENCGACLARLETERATVELSRTILRAADPASTPLPPFEQVMQLRSPPVRSRPARSRVIPVAWAASLVVAISAGWVAREAMRSPAMVVFVPESELASMDRLEAAETAASVQRQSDEGPLPGASPSPPESPPSRAVPPTEELVAESRTLPTAAGDVPESVQPAVYDRGISIASSADVEVDETVMHSPTSGVSDSRLARAAAPGVQEALRMPAPSIGPSEATLVHGRVTDLMGVPLAGVQVMAPNYSVGTITDTEGKYSLPVPPALSQQSDTLTIVAQTVGWERQVRPLSLTDDTEDPQDFRLRPSALQLEGIVAVGYGASARDWQHLSLESAEAAVARRLPRVPGLRVLSTEMRVLLNGGKLIRVRQQMRSGHILELEFQPNPNSGQPSRPVAGLQPDEMLVNTETTLGAQLRLRSDGLLITIRAPVSLAELHELAQSLE